MSPQISVIIPVYEEEKTIRRTLAHLCRLNFSKHLEIIVVDGDPKGNTLQAVTEKNVKKLIGPKGRGAQMNFGANVAEGNILLFLHADTFLPPNALPAILSAVAPNRVGGGAFNLVIGAGKKHYRLIETAVRIRTRLTGIPYGDQAIFIKKHVFNDIGGYPEIPIMEDVTIMQRIKHQGKTIIIIPAAVITSARRWETEGVIYCTLRNWVLIFLYSIGISPSKLARYY